MFLLRSHGWGKQGIEERISEERELLLEEIKNKNGNIFDPGDIVHISVGNVICCLLFGSRYSHDNKELARLLYIVNWMATFFAESAERDFIPLLQLTPSYLKLITEFKPLNDELNNFVQKHIEYGRERMRRDPCEIPRDFIESYLMILENPDSESGGKITQNWLHDIVIDLFVAGADTTATTLKWALLYMVKYPHVQRKVQEELDRVVGPPSNHGQTSLALRDRLPYTEATILEIQRLAAIIPTAMPHCVTKDVTFRGYHIPKETQVCRLRLGSILRVERFRFKIAPHGLNILPKTD